MNITVATLFSGSSGNSVLVGDGENYILIDAGRSARAVSTALSELGVSLSDLRAVFVTHEHCDHIAALEVLSKKCPLPIHITEDSLSAVVGKEHLIASAIAHTPIFSVRVGKMTVSSFRTSHDSAMSVGYTVTFDGADTKLGIMTDTGRVTESMLSSLSGATHVILEANHDFSLLAASPYPLALRERIASARGHLSNTASAETAVTLATGGTEAFLLAHLSENANTPDTALCAVTSALSRSGLSPSVKVASRYSVTRLI